MKNKILYFFLTILTLSCSRQLFDNSYTGEPNYRNFYLVDSIKILDAVRIHSPKFGGQFITSKGNLRNYDQKAEFFLRADVFFLGDNIYRHLDTVSARKNSYPDFGMCSFVKSNTKFKDLEIYEFKGQTVDFFLGLINANFYYIKNNSYAAFKSPFKDTKSRYLKIVFPVCKAQ